VDVFILKKSTLLHVYTRFYQELLFRKLPTCINVTHFETYMKPDTKDTNNNPFIVTPKNPDSRWIALDSNDAVISEGKTPFETIQEAEKITQEYALMFVPIEGNSCFF